MVPASQNLDTPSFSASVVIGIDDTEKPLMVDIRSQSNTAEDFAMFLTIVVESGFIKSGDYFVFDNAAVHFGGDSSQELLDLLLSHKITPMALPTYSPELNPIERCFGVIKSYLRFHRDTKSPLLDDIVKGFALIDNQLIIKEYERSRDYFIENPFLLPPDVEKIITDLQAI